MWDKRKRCRKGQEEKPLLFLSLQQDCTAFGIMYVEKTQLCLYISVEGNQIVKIKCLIKLSY